MGGSGRARATAVLDIVGSLASRGDESLGPMVAGTERRTVVAVVASRVPRHRDGSPVRVAVDGVDGAGKMIFADELAAVLSADGRPVIRASVDDFHRRRAERYRRGRDSPTGFWLDSFDYPRLRRELLDPLASGGSRWYRAAVHDLAADQYLDEPAKLAPAGAVLVVDGLFLHRDELYQLWDFSVLLDVSFTETAKRMALRDGTHPDPEHPSMRRYVDAQRAYFRLCDPARRADMVIDNSDWRRPTLRAEPSR